MALLFTPPFPFMVTSFSFTISLLALHLTQYPVVAIIKKFLAIYLRKPTFFVLGNNKSKQKHPKNLFYYTLNEARWVVNSGYLPSFQP